MKKLLFLCGLLWSAVASAQFTPGQLLTAAELNNQFALYAPLAGATYTGSVTIPTLTVSSTFSMPASTVLPSGVTATTNGRLDNSLQVATDAFVNQQGASAVATVPFANVTGGTYNQATLGSGCQVVVFASGGVITSSLTISNPGSGYAVGDLLAVPAGNSDAVLRVTGVSGGGVTSVGIAYGGTGYTTGNVVTTMGVPPGRRAVVLTGTLTSNLTFIIQSGTYLTASREVEFINNTTGAFTITVKLSNGAGGSTGTGVVLPQGSNNSTAVSVYTDGVNDVWLANSPAGIGNGTMAAQNANAVAITGGAISGTPLSGSTGSFTTLSASSTVSGAGFTTLLSPYLLSATASSTYATIAQATTALAATGGSLNGVTVGATTPSTVAATTLSSTGNFTPSQTNGIVGTTTNNSANAGSVGEVISASVASGSAVSLTTGAATNVTSISLTAGDWDVWGQVVIQPAGTTTTASAVAWVNTVSAAQPNYSSNAAAGTLSPFAASAGAAQVLQTGTARISVASTTTVYLGALSAFSVSTSAAYGYITARRRR